MALDATMLAKLRVKAGLAATDNSQDGALATIYSMALALAELYCDRKFEHKTQTDVFTHIEGGTVSLKRYPITSITSITPTTTYHVNNDNGVVHFDARAHEHQLTVVYQGGYNPLPPDLEMAMLDIFDSLWQIHQGGGSSAGDLRRITQDGATVEFFNPDASAVTGGSGLLNFKPIPDLALAVLSLYRREFA